MSPVYYVTYVTGLYPSSTPTSSGGQKPKQTQFHTQKCETNPIRPHSHPAPPQKYETNPISQGQQPKNAKQTQSHPAPPPKYAKQTQFSFTRCPPTPDTPQLCETNPIPPRTTAQLCETNPIPPGQPPKANSQKLFLRNEPNSPTQPPDPHPNYAKRTQLPPPRGIPSAGLRSEAQRPKVEGPVQSASPKAIPNKQTPRRTPFLQNEPNFIPLVHQFYETNPISPPNRPPHWLSHPSLCETNPICRPTGKILRT